MDGRTPPGAETPTPRIGTLARPPGDFLARQAPGEELVLGLDEAGRGSLVGPLVVGGFVLPRSRLPLLVPSGVRDSKLLTPSQREAVYRHLGSTGRRLAVSLAPAVVDRHVRQGALNHLEARAFGQLVRRSGATMVYADACDPVAPRFGREIARWAGDGVRVLAEHRADVNHPVVAAASIVAKVRRDRAIARLRETLGGGLGSGYPSDERTCDFVRDVLRSGAPAPDWVRASWRTMARLKPRPTGPSLESFVP